MRSFLVAAVLLLSASSARAEDLAGRFGVGGTVGGGISMGSTWVRDNSTFAPLYGGSLRYGICEHLSAGLSLDYVSFNDKHITAMPILANAFYNLAPGSSWNPNVHAGLGLARLGNIEPGTKDHEVFSLRYGVGMDKFIHENISVGAYMDHLWADKGGVSMHDLSTLNMGGNIQYWFGGKREPAPPPPPKDSDKDGVYDDSDKCPGTPQGSPVDKDGCPLDADKDGVYDHLDKCPTTPQGMTVNAAGCHDSDKDGVYDDSDKCPETPLGKKVDPVGCPIKEKVSIELLIKFDTAKSIVKPEYDPELQRVADFLKAHPDATAEIEGHTDSMGNHDYNMNLSQERAGAVRQALLDRFGVAADRLTSKGYGPDKPVADNDTPESRAKNRRVMATFSSVE
ncbi:MAG: OmpA family protein [Elusimicrobiota bacterium]|jgi:OOP family OmpA-OmpF porin